jgi:hypothetical protein
MLDGRLLMCHGTQKVERKSGREKDFLRPSEKGVPKRPGVKVTFGNQILE